LISGNGKDSQRARLLLICQGSDSKVEGVAVMKRFLDQVGVLKRIPGIELHVAWLLNWHYRCDPARRQWVEDVRKDWFFSNVVIYSLPLSRLGFAGKVGSGIFRLVALLIFLLRHRIRVVMVHTFTGIQGLVLRLKRFLAVRCLLDMQGAIPEELAYKGWSPTIIRRLELRERKALEGSDVVFCVSRKMVEHFGLKHKTPANKFRVVPCCISADSVGVDSERRREVRESLGIEGKFVIAYSGGTDRYQQVPAMCALFADVSKRWNDAVWLVLSWGDLDLFRRSLAAYGVNESRSILRRLEQKDVHDHLIAADVGLLLRDDNVLNRVSSPTKFAEYLASGLPVVTTPYVGDYADVVRREKIGTVVELPPASDVDSLIDFLSVVRRHREEFAHRCLDYAARELVWERYETGFSKSVEEAIRRRHQRSAGRQEHSEGRATVA